MERNLLNPELLCRACAAPHYGDKVDLLASESLSEKFVLHTKTQFNRSDSLPKQLCLQCYMRLEVFNEFYENCGRTYMMFMEVYSKYVVSTEIESFEITIQNEQITPQDEITTFQNEPELIESNPILIESNPILIDSNLIVPKNTARNTSHNRNFSMKTQRDEIPNDMPEFLPSDNTGEPHEEEIDFYSNVGLTAEAAAEERNAIENNQSSSSKSNRKQKQVIISKHRKTFGRRVYKVLICPYCQLKFMQRCSYDKHLETHKNLLENSIENNTEPNNFDPVLEDTKPNIDLLRTQHIEGRYCVVRLCRKRCDMKCPHCPRIFWQKNSYEEHLATHTDCTPDSVPSSTNQITVARIRKTIKKENYVRKKPYAPYACSKCPIRFYQIERFEAHKNLHAMKKVKIRKINEKRLAKLAARANRINVNCPHCSRKFIHKHKYEAHLAAHSASKNEQLTTTKIKRPFIRKKPYAPYACDKCPIRFYQIDRYEAHKHSHTEKKCTNCGLTFKSKIKLERHVKKGCKIQIQQGVAIKQERQENKKEINQEHNGLIKSIETEIDAGNMNLWFICKICSQQFNTKSEYNVHRRQHNTYKCEICGLTKCSRYQLILHMNVHTKTTKYPCPSCHQVFFYPGNLKRHVRVIHLGIKLHKCQKCGNRYGEASDLRKHQKRGKCMPTQ